MKEIWKDIESFNGYYQVSNLGRIKAIPVSFTMSNGQPRTKKGCIISQQIQNSGYAICHLHKNNKRKAATVHRLVAKAFIPNPDRKGFVNHINWDKTDNRASNLEWCTEEENMQHASKNGILSRHTTKRKGLMKNIGSTYGFANSQKHLKEATPIVAFNPITQEKIPFRSIREASMVFKIDHKGISTRMKVGKDLRGFFFSKSEQSVMQFED